MFVNARAIIERQTDVGIELLLQIRNKPNERKALEFPGGRIEAYESIEAALHREVFEETGLKVTEILHETNRHVYTYNHTAIEGLTPFFVYQTMEGPVDSIGFVFRCRVEEQSCATSDESYGHRWVDLSTLEKKSCDDPETFDWLTQGILDNYLKWRKGGRKGEL